MADDYDGDDGGWDFDDNWIYMEDDYGLADELAETQVPDPGYAGTQLEIDMEAYDPDFFDYWDDVEYIDDAYWDHGGGQKLQQDEGSAGQKRKRVGAAKISAVDKRRKVSSTQRGRVDALGTSQPDNVIFRSREERIRQAWQLPPMSKARTSVAFLANWRERYAGKDGEVRADTMPADMQQAALATDEDLPADEEAADAMSVGEEDGDWEDDDVQDGVEVDVESALANLDPDMLKAILKQKLGEAGLEGMDEGAFMATLNKMLAGDEDEAAGELADTLLGQATSADGSGALSGWLSQQGVSLPPAEDDDASSVATVELPECPGRVGQRSQVSPPDSAISGLAQAQGKSTQMAMRTGSPTTLQHDVAAGTRHRKGKKVTFDVPPSSSQVVEYSDGSGTVTSNASLTKQATTTRAARSKATSKSNAQSSSRAKPEDQLQEELQESLPQDEEDSNAVKATTPDVVRSTRKRKAPAEAVEAEEDGDKGKQRAVKEPATRKTRSARAKAGK